MLTQDQHDIRRTAIGASDAAAVMGIDPWRTPLEVWLEKVGITEKIEAKFGSPMYWGNLLEESVARAYEDFLGVKVADGGDTWIHKDYSHIICHLDRVLVGQNKILECKTTHIGNSNKWGECGSDDVPINYLIQVQHQMAITGYEEADIAVLIGGSEFKYYTIKRDEQIINEILRRENEFWNNYVLPQVAPPCSNKDDVKLLYPIDNGIPVDATEEIANAAHQLAELKAKSKEIDKQQSEFENQITIFMRDASSLQYYGKEIVTWKADKNCKRTLRLKI